MITIKNSVKNITLSNQWVKEVAQKIMDLLEYSDYDLGIWLTNNETIHRYNRDYRGKDKPTDILSFPYHPQLQPGQRIAPQEDEDKNLGDIIISLEYVVQAAQELGVPLQERMKVLLVHGICHLLGYDHIKDEDFVVMDKQEQWLLKKI